MTDNIIGCRLFTDDITRDVFQTNEGQLFVA